MNNLLTFAGIFVALLTTGGNDAVAAVRQAGPWYASPLIAKLLVVVAVAVVALAGVLAYRMRQARRWEEEWYESAEPAPSSLDDAGHVIGEPAALAPEPQTLQPAPGQEQERRRQEQAAAERVPVSRH